MAASTVSALATATVSPRLLSEASSLSSRDALRTTPLVQPAPVTYRKSNVSRLVAVRSSLSEERTARREILASFLAAGAALSFASEAFANPFSNPFASAKNKADQVVQGSKDASPNLSKLGNSAGNAVDNIKGRAVDGLFGSNKRGPIKSGNSVASAKEGTGSAIGDAEKRLSSFGKNPFSQNLENATKDAQNTIGRETGSARAGKELVGQDSTRVDEATRRVNAAGSDFQKKAGDAINEGKNFFGQAPKSTPDLPSTPQLPEIPNIPTPDPGNFFKDLAKGAQSKVEDAKSGLGVQ